MKLFLGIVVSMLVLSGCTQSTPETSVVDESSPLPTQYEEVNIQAE